MSENIFRYFLVNLAETFDNSSAVALLMAPSLNVMHVALLNSSSLGAGSITS